MQTLTVPSTYLTRWHQFPKTKKPFPTGMITLPALYGCNYTLFEPRKCTPAAQTSIVVVLCEKVIMNLTGRLDT